MALTAVACLTACDDSSSSSSNEIPTYKTEAALPDTCEMEVAKAGDTYFACFENKWVEVTDSATVEKLKEGLDEDDLKEELEDLMAKLSSSSKKPSSSSKKVESSDDSAEPESSSSEEECTGRRCKTGDSSSSKKSGGGNGGSGSGEGGEGSSPSSAESSSPSSATSGSSELARDAHFKILDEFVDWKSGTKAVVKGSDVTGAETALKAAGFEGTFYDKEQSAIESNIFLWVLSGKNFGIQLNDYVMTRSIATEEDSTQLAVIFRQDGSDLVAYVDAYPRGKCGSYAYNKETQICDEDVIKTPCGTGYIGFLNAAVCDEGVIKGFCGDNYELYDSGEKFCDARDGHIYGYATGYSGVKMMTENVAYKTTNAKYFKDSEANKALGYFYTQAESEDACPSGWSLPDEDFYYYDLFNEFTSAYTVLKFSANGYYAGYYGEGWQDAGSYANYWTSSVYNDGAHTLSQCNSSDCYVGDYGWDEDDMYPVRCIN